MNPKPTVGRIVHYMSRGSLDGKFPSVPRAAIVTDVSTEATIIDRNGGHIAFGVRLCVLNPEGIFFSDWLEEGTGPGNWMWPPRF